MADFQCLLFLKIWTAASKLVVTLVKLHYFFVFLLSQVWERIEKITKEVCSWRSGSTFSWRSTSWRGSAPLTIVWMADRANLFALLKGHWSRAWRWVSMVSRLHRLQEGEGVSGVHAQSRCGDSNQRERKLLHSYLLSLFLTVVLVHHLVC